MSGRTWNSQTQFDDECEPEGVGRVRGDGEIWRKLGKIHRLQEYSVLRRGLKNAVLSPGYPSKSGVSLIGEGFISSICRCSVELGNRKNKEKGWNSFQDVARWEYSSYHEVAVDIMKDRWIVQLTTCLSNLGITLVEGGLPVFFIFFTNFFNFSETDDTTQGAEILKDFFVIFSRSEHTPIWI
jgi:hypothetical protein